MQPQSEVERRVLADRRQEPTSAWDTLRGWGWRMRLRRRRESRGEYFVDRFSAATLAAVIVLLILSIVDGWITLHLLGTGCDEVNPLMAWLLEWGVLPFLLGKYALTAFGLPILCVYKNFRLLGTGFRVGYLIPTFIVLYVVLLAYQTTLL